MVLPHMEVTMSPGRWARWPGMFSTAGMNAVTGMAGLSCARARMAPMVAAPPAISYFIFSMPSAGLMEMPPVSKVTPLPTRPRWLEPEAAAGRFGAAHGHAQQATHPQLPHAVLVQDFAFQAVRGGHLAGAFREQGGRQAIGRLVDQLAGEILRFGDDTPALDSLPEVRSAGRCGDGELFEGLSVVLCGLITVGLVVAQQGAFGGRARVFRACQSGIQVKRGTANRAALQEAHGRAGHLAKFRRSEGFRLASSDYQQTPGPQPGSLVQQGHLQHFAGDFPGFYPLRQAGARVLLPLEGHQHDGVRLNGLQRLVSQVQFHFAVILRFWLYSAGWRRELQLRPCGHARLRACRAVSCPAPRRSRF